MFKQKKTKPLISKANKANHRFHWLNARCQRGQKADLEEYERVMLDIYEDVYHASERRFAGQLALHHREQRAYP